MPERFYAVCVDYSGIFNFATEAERDAWVKKVRGEAIPRSHVEPVIRRYIEDQETP